ncbi:MAG: peptidase [Myxococcales bacterium]|nr:peptidase [Myxococcales bacterium]
MRALTILLLVAVASPAASAAERTRVSVPVERYVLPNGLVVILHEDHRLPTVVVDLLFHVGSKDEKSGRSGFAHLFEHLMFMGTKNVPNGSFDTIMEGAGGQNNASTSEDLTNYFDMGPANLLETFMWLEADRLSTLPDAMTKAKVDLQRDVVKNERRQGIENRPYGRVELEIPDKLYPATHPYHHPVIGSHEDLNAASVEDVKSFFRQFYVPSNASLVVSGDFASAEAKKLVEKYFAWMPKKPVPPHAAPKPVVMARPARGGFKDAVQLPRVVLAWHSPPGFSAGDAESEVLAAVLGGGKSSRLYQALVYDRKLAESVQVEQRPTRYGSQFVIEVTAQSGHTAAELEQAADEEVAKLLGAAPASDAEVERARAYVQTHSLRALESPVLMAVTINQYEYYFGDPKKMETLQLGRFDEVTTASVGTWAKKILGTPRVTITVEPDGGAK